MPGPHQNVPMGEIAIEEPHCCWYKKLFFFIHQGFGSYRMLYCIHVNSIIQNVNFQWETREYFEYKSASSLLSFPPLNMQTEHRFSWNLLCVMKKVNYVSTYAYMYTFLSTFQYVEQSIRSLQYAKKCDKWFCPTSICFA